MLSPISTFDVSPYSGYSSDSGRGFAHDLVAPAPQGRPGLEAPDSRGTKKIKDSDEAGQECQTCKNRKYVDGSNENDVSFKTPGHIDPGNSAAAVMGHEREHVANAVAEGNKENKELLSVSVTLKTSVCPECGRVYVSGGETSTTMRTTRSEGGQNMNPYAKKQADLDYLMAAGANLDLSA